MQGRSGELCGVALGTPWGVKCTTMRLNSLLAAAMTATTLSALPGICVSAPAQPVTRIILLGTNGGPTVSVLRAEPATLLVVAGVPYLIDAGAGVARQIALAGFEPSLVRTIFITHHHIDHDAGLSALMSVAWFDPAWDDHSLPPVQIYGPPATQFLARAALEYLSVSERIFRAGAPALQPAAAMFQAHDIQRKGEFYHDARIAVSAAENSHYYFKSGTAATGQDMSFSYRFDTPNGSVVFTGDSGPSEAVTELARNADVLVSEVCLCDTHAKDRSRKISAGGTPTAAALGKEEAFHMLHEHLTPEEVGKMAAAAHVKVVILTHFVPGDATDPTSFTAGVMKYFSGPVIPGKDLLEYDLH